MSTAVDDLPASYAAVHRYNGAVLQHDQRERIVPMAIQPRDFAIVLDVWRYKFLTAPMVHELHWEGGSLWPAQRRLKKMFNAGLLERFRPVSLRGSYPWTYHLGERGHVMLRDSQVVDTTTASTTTETGSSAATASSSPSSRTCTLVASRPGAYRPSLAITRTVSSTPTCAPWGSPSAPDRAREGWFTLGVDL
jgi:hypothetical protein